MTVGKRRPIVFWSHRNRPSFTMRGRQVVAALAARGHDCRCEVGPAWWSLRGIRDAVIVCIKSEPGDIAKFHKNGNRVVWDAIDHAVGDPVGAYDAILCASHHVKREIDRTGDARLTEVFYHHADPGIKVNTAKPDHLRLAYVGEIGNSLSVSGEIPGVERIDFKRRGWRERLQAFNGHFSARREAGKSVVKLANSVFANAVFLTGREPGVVELLGDDYPFYIDSLDDAAIAEAVRRTADAVGSRLWFQALDRMSGLRTRLGLEHSVSRYESLFTRLQG